MVWLNNNGVGAWARTVETEESISTFYACVRMPSETVHYTTVDSSDKHDAYHDADI